METRSVSEPSVASTVEIITWFLLVVSVFAVLARLSTKWAMTKRLNWDDFSCITSLALNIGAGVAVSIMAANGMGIAQATLPLRESVTFHKAVYVIGLLYIGTLCFAKLSIILLFRLISRDQLHQRLGLALGISIVSWGFISLMVASFQCGLPAVWQIDQESCYNRPAFWRAMGVVNILTDTCLIALPLIILHKLRISLKKKITVLGCFCARGFDIVATACQLAYTSELKSTNITQDVWPWILCAQIIQTISIVTSCVPYLRPLLDSFPSGMLVNDDITRRGSSSTKGSSGYIKARRPEHNYVLRDMNLSVKTELQDYTNTEVFSPFSPERSTVPNFTGQPFQSVCHIDFAPRKSSAGDGRSMRSSHQSQSRIIKATTTIETAWHNRRASEH